MGLVSKGKDFIFAVGYHVTTEECKARATCCSNFQSSHWCHKEKVAEVSDQPGKGVQVKEHVGLD